MRPSAGQSSHTQPIAEALCFATTQASSQMRGLLGLKGAVSPPWPVQGMPVPMAGVVQLVVGQ